MLTRFALDNRTLMLAAMLICLIMGPISFFSHPSREDPSITIRSAQVIAQFPGMSAERVENLLTSKIEEKIREIPEVWHVESTSSTGQSLIKVDVRDQYTDMSPIWADLRNKMEDVRGALPSGTQGPIVNDDQGNVGMATLAITGEGFENWEIREAAKELRKLIYANVPGVRKVEFFGVEEQRVFVEFDNIRLAQLGIDPNSIINSITRQNVILPGGRVEADGTTMMIEPTGDFGGLEDLAGLSIRIDGDTPITLYLRDIATIRMGYEDPPATPAYFNGKPAVVVSISMIDQVDSKQFSFAMKGLVEEFQKAMPWGIELEFITFQQNEIDDAIFSVLNNLWQTILVVLAVVEEEPAHGFALSRLLAPDSDLGRIVTLRRPQVYRAIDRLADGGLIEPVAVEPGDAGPKRTIFTITDLGRGALTAWLDRPVEHVRDLRVELLIKLRLLERAGRSPEALLAAQRRTLGPTLDRLIAGDPGGGDVVDRWRATTAEAAARFLGHVPSPDPTPPVSDDGRVDVEVERGSGPQ